MTTKVLPRFLLFLFLAGLLLVACQNEDDEAVTATDRYLEAVLVNDDVYLEDHTCAAVPPGSASQYTLALWNIGMAVRSAPEFDREDLLVNVRTRHVGGEEDEAHVELAGTVTFPPNLPPSEFGPLPVENVLPLNEVWRMVNEEGTWKWCGGLLGAAQ